MKKSFSWENFAPTRRSKRSAPPKMIVDCSLKASMSVMLVQRPIRGTRLLAVGTMAVFVAWEPGTAPLGSNVSLSSQSDAIWNLDALKQNKQFKIRND